METPSTGLDQQIREARAALARLRSLKKFRGKKVLVRDTEQHLARLLETQEESEHSEDSAAVAAV